MSEQEMVAEIKRIRERMAKLEGENEALVKKQEARIATLEKKIELQSASDIDWDA